MKRTVCLLWVMYLCSVVQAQPIQPADDLQVFFKPVDENGNTLQSRDAASINNGTANLQVTYVIQLTTYTGIQNFHLKLGTTIGNNNLAEISIPFDPAPENLPSGVTYKRTENTVYIGIGTYTGMQQYYSEVKLEDANGVFSDATEFTNIN